MNHIGCVDKPCPKCAASEQAYERAKAALRFAAALKDASPDAQQAMVALVAEHLGMDVTLRRP